MTTEAMGWVVGVLGAVIAVLYYLLRKSQTEAGMLQSSNIGLRDENSALSAAVREWRKRTEDANVEIARVTAEHLLAAKIVGEHGERINQLRVALEREMIRANGLASDVNCIRNENTMLADLAEKQAGVIGRMKRLVEERSNLVQQWSGQIGRTLERIEKRDYTDGNGGKFNMSKEHAELKRMADRKPFKTDDDPSAASDVEESMARR